MSTDAPGDGPARPASPDVVWSQGQVDPARRAALLGHGAGTLWFTGLSGSGKSTIAQQVERRLVEDGVAAYLLDGDNVRHGLNGDLGFSPGDRRENIRRVGEVCRLLVDAGLVVLATFISPYRADRDRVRALHPAGRFHEVFVDTPLEVCEARDPKGLYVRARDGSIPDFSGVSAPYEPPTRPELRLPTEELGVEGAVEAVLAHAREHLLP